VSTRRQPSLPPRIPGFEYVRLLGMGGFADVFEYRQELPRRSVAVKVLRPGVERRVARGLDSMRLGAKLVEKFVAPARRLEPQAFVEIIARSLQLELDMRLEAAAASELAEVMAKDGYMSAPAIVWDGVGKRVLTLEWAPGLPMTDPALEALPGLDKDALADKVVRAFLIQALDHGVFHADLHEGNLFADAPDKVTAIDFGIVGRLGPAERRYLAEILGASSAATTTVSAGSTSRPVMCRRTIRSTPSPRPCAPSASR